MSKENENAPFYKTLLSAGFLGLISTLIGFVYNGYQDRQLERIKFQNTIIERILAFETQSEKEKYLNEIISIGAIDTTEIRMDSFLYSGSYSDGKNAALKDIKFEKGIVGAMAQFIGKMKRLPASFKELKDSIPMESILDLATCDIFYDTYQNSSKFILKFCGSDGVTYTSDDHQYRINGMIIERKLGVESWESYLKL
jgi:hypothetical protein